MSFDIARGSASLGSRPRVLARRSRSARRPARRPSQHTASHAFFRSTVWKYWRKSGRHSLLWRRTKDPYKILVSEIMLQQTQVDRVVPYYREFLRKFPTVRALAKASLAEVLKVWSGLGYNRRAKFLHDAAIEIVSKHGDKVPRDYESLRKLSGVGDYTTRAVRVFAWNEADILIETNIRSVFIHRFFVSRTVLDTQIASLAIKAAERQDPQEWHWALMDYGAYLKRSGVRNNHRSAHYVKQSKFEDSVRQARGHVLRHIANNRSIDLVGRYKKALVSLARDGLVVSQKGKWRIA